MDGTQFYMITVVSSKFLTMHIDLLKFIYSEKATKFCEIFTLLLTTVHTVKSKVKILQNCVAFSEYMNFIYRGPNLYMHFFSPSLQLQFLLKTTFHQSCLKLFQM